MALFRKARAFLSSNTLLSFSTGSIAIAYTGLAAGAAYAITPILVNGGMISVMLGMLGSLNPALPFVAAGITASIATICGILVNNAQRDRHELVQENTLLIKNHGRAFAAGQGAGLALMAAMYTATPSIDVLFNKEAAPVKTGPKPELVYQMTSNNCQGEAAQEFIRFMREQNVPAYCLKPQ